MAEEKVGLKSDAEDAQGVYPDIQDEAMKKQMDRLNFLDMMDEIYIQQPFRGKEYCLQCCLCWEVKNEYKAFRANKDTKDTTPIFTLTEESDCFFRVCCPSTVRPFTLRAVISEGNEDAGTEIFRLERPYRCGCCCCSPSMCTFKIGKRASPQRWAKELISAFLSWRRSTEFSTITHLGCCHCSKRENALFPICKVLVDHIWRFMSENDLLERCKRTVFGVIVRSISAFMTRKTGNCVVYSDFVVFVIVSKRDLTL